MCTIVSSLDSNVKEVLIRISGYCLFKNLSGCYRLCIRNTETTTRPTCRSSNGQCHISFRISKEVLSCTVTCVVGLASSPDIKEVIYVIYTEITCDKACILLSCYAIKNNRPNTFCLNGLLVATRACCFLYENNTSLGLTVSGSGDDSITFCYSRYNSGLAAVITRSNSCYSLVVRCPCSTYVRGDLSGFTYFESQ